MRNFKQGTTLTEQQQQVVRDWVAQPPQYALCNTTHNKYDAWVQLMSDIFDQIEWGGVYNPILNLVGDRALIKLYWSINHPAIIDNNFDPASRDMTEWEEEITF